MNRTDAITGNAALLEWIGESSDDSLLDADIEALKDCLPGIVEARMGGYEELEAAIQCVSLTIQNLRKVRQAVAAMWK